VRFFLVRGSLAALYSSKRNGLRMQYHPPMQNPLDLLEEHLSRARIDRMWDNSGGGGHPSLRIQFRGGVHVVAKPDDRGENGSVMVRAEAAAWRIARVLNWTDLMAATVLRPIAIDGRGTRESSAMVSWPQWTFCPEPSTLPEDEVLRGAVYDVVIQHTDRGWNNWLGVSTEAGTDPHLRLIDHGHAFGQFPQRVFGSTLFEVKEGADLADGIREALQRLADDGEDEHGLLELLPAPNVEAVRGRAKRLAESGRLELPT
jgi:hypothetical protein